MFLSKMLSSGGSLIAFMVGLPLLSGFLLWLCRKNEKVKFYIALASTVLNFIFAISLYLGESFGTAIHFAPFGFEYSFRVNNLTGLFLVLTAVLFLCVSVYTVENTKTAGYSGLYLLYLYISIALVNGALLSGNLATILFFWEGLMAVLFAILLIGNCENPKTSVKALSVSAFSALTLMLGVILIVHIAHTAEISEIERIPVTGTGLFAFVCVMLGALGQMGCFPFHSWIPKAADDAPTAFLAAFPGAISGILGTYLAVISVHEVFDLQSGSGMSVLVIALGVITFVLGAAMALVQKELKRLLAYTPVSLSGIIAIGFGTGTEAGISGAVYALINNALCLCGLFILCGVLEKKAGTTDLSRLNGSLRKTPIVAVCFGVLSLSALGFPLLGGFFADQLIFGAVLKTNVVLFIAAFIGVFLLALNFIRAGRTLLFGEGEIQFEVTKNDHITLIPVYVLSGLTLLLSVNPLPLNAIQSALNASESFAGLPASAAAMIGTIIVLILAVADHIFGYKKTGSALDVYEHIRCAPVIRNIYDWADKGCLDPYQWLVSLVGAYGSLCTRIEHGVSWVYDKGVPGLVKGTGNALHRFNNGRLSRYLYLVVGGLLLLLILFFTKI